MSKVYSLVKATAFHSPLNSSTYFNLDDFLLLYSKYQVGQVSDRDLMSIADWIKGKPKRFGRVLGLQDNDLDAIEQERRLDPLETSYEVLKKWKQWRASEATYKVIADSLCNRTVNLRNKCNELTQCCD